MTLPWKTYQTAEREFLPPKRDAWNQLKRTGLPLLPALAQKLPQTVSADAGSHRTVRQCKYLVRNLFFFVLQGLLLQKIPPFAVFQVYILPFFLIRIGQILIFF